MKTFLFILCVIFVLIVLLLLSPTKIHFYIFKEDIRLSAQTLFFRIRLYPRKERKRKKPKKEKSTKKLEAQIPPQQTAAPTASEQSSAPEQAKKRGKKAFPKLSIDLIREYFNFGIETLGKLRRLVLIEKLKIHADIACDDPAKTAMAYGSTAAAVNILLPEIERKIRIRKTDIFVTSAFDKTETEIEFGITVSVVAICAIIVGLKLLYKFSKINKGGAL